MILDSEVFTEIPEERIVKLSSIIRYQHFGHPKLAHDVLSNEVLNILLCDICQGFHLHPLREIINANYQKFNLSYTSWEGTQDV